LYHIYIAVDNKPVRDLFKSVFVLQLSLTCNDHQSGNSSARPHYVEEANVPVMMKEMLEIFGVVTNTLGMNG
jgi:hypothetical protein